MRGFVPEEMRTLSKHVKDAGATLYAVGGLPRNALLSLPPSDLDIASRLLPHQIQALVSRAGYRHFLKAEQFGTVEIHINGRVFEHTTFRGERYGEGGAHRPERVSFGATLEEDAFRRDFSCNALYYDILGDTLLDPTGGLKDIENRILRATTQDPYAILRDDGLRVLRLVRFAAELGFRVEARTFEAARDCAHGLVDIAWERKRDELVKLLLSDIRYPALTKGQRSPVIRALFMLHALHALPYTLPELLEGDGVLQRAKYHAHDVLRHNFYACAISEPKLAIRLAALLHDVGKPAALREKGLPLDIGGQDESMRARLKKGDTPMLGHDALGAKIARDMLVRLRFPNKLIDDVCFLIEHHMYDLNGMAKESTLRTRFAQFGYERAQSLCAIREADVLGSGLIKQFQMQSWRALLEKMKAEQAPFSIHELSCTGEDIMRWCNIPPGKRVGEILQKLFLHCARHPKDNTAARLEKLAKGI